jgi:hypothetical protein
MCIAVKKINMGEMAGVIEDTPELWVSCAVTA